MPEPAAAAPGDAPRERGEIKPAVGATHHELPVQHDVAGEPFAEGLHDLGEGASEGTLLAGLQPGTATAHHGQTAVS